jgi:predicted phage gp36 major capsid-like protein
MGRKPIRSRGSAIIRWPTQFIAALGEPHGRSGSGAQSWGVWRQDPGPRGVWLDNYAQLQAAGGVAPAQWKFDNTDWWLEENGLIMEKQDFSVPPGKYVVTGDREVMTVLTVHPMDRDGDKRWELGDGATLHDVTHLPCRSAENVEITASDKAWDNVTLNARKLAALTRMSTEYVEDAIIDAAANLADEMAYALAEAKDDAHFNGDGTATYGGIVGVVGKPIGAAGLVDATSGTDTFAEVSADDLARVMAALLLYAHKGAAWYCSQPAFQLMFQALAIAAGGATAMETGSLQIAKWSGYPIRISQKLETSTGALANGTIMGILGDFSRAAMLGDRRGIRAQVLEERYAEFDQFGVRSTERYDINVHDVGDATTAGPIVALVSNP